PLPGGVARTLWRRRGMGSLAGMSARSGAPVAARRARRRPLSAAPTAPRGLCREGHLEAPRRDLRDPWRRGLLSPLPAVDGAGTRNDQPPRRRHGTASLLAADVRLDAG